MPQSPIPFRIRWHALKAALRWAWRDSSADRQAMHDVVAEVRRYELERIGRPEEVQGNLEGWHLLRPEGRREDGRWWLLTRTLTPGDGESPIEGVVSLTDRIPTQAALLMAWWDSAPTPALSQWAYATWHAQRNPKDPLDAAMAAAFALEGRDLDAPATEAVRPKQCTPAERHWMAYWAAGIGRETAVHALLPKAPTEAWWDSAPMQTPTDWPSLTWLGWLAWFDRGALMEEALAAGASARVRTAWPPALIDRANENLRHWQRHLTRFDWHASPEWSTDHRSDLSKDVGGVGFNPLRWAVAARSPQAMQVLLRYRPPTDEVSEDGRTPLSLLLQTREWALTQQYLDLTPEVLPEHPPGRDHDWAGSPLSLAIAVRAAPGESDEVQSLREQVVRRVVARAGADPSHRFDPNHGNRFYPQALFEALQSPDGAVALQAIVAQLTAGDASWAGWSWTRKTNHPQRDAQAFSPLRAALEPGRLEHLKVLAGQGVDVNALLKENDTDTYFPLLHALVAWSPEALPIWLAHAQSALLSVALQTTAPSNAPTTRVYEPRRSEGRRPGWRQHDDVWAAAVRGVAPHVALTHLLADARIPRPTATAALWELALQNEGNYDAFAAVCTHLGPMPMPSEAFQTNLPQALLKKPIAHVERWLKEQWLPLEAKDEAGHTPLGAALLAQNQPMFERLLAAGASTSAADAEGDSLRALIESHPAHAWARPLLAAHAAEQLRASVDRTAVPPASAPPRRRL